MTTNEYTVEVPASNGEGIFAQRRFPTLKAAMEGWRKFVADGQKRAEVRCNGCRVADECYPRFADEEATMFADAEWERLPSRTKLCIEGGLADEARLVIEWRAKWAREGVSRA